MWWPLLTALLVHAVVVQPISGYSRFGRQSDEIRALYSKSAPLSINEQMLGGSNIHYYGRFRNGHDDVLNRYFHRLA